MITKAIRIIVGVGLPIIILIIFFSREIRVSTENKQTIQQQVAQELARREVVKKSIDRPWRYESEGKKGYYDGENHPTESEMTMIEDDGKVLKFWVHYYSLGKKESTIFTLDDRTIENATGIWIKERPRESGVWKLKDERFQLLKDKGGYCIAWCSNVKDTNTWFNANLRQL